VEVTLATGRALAWARVLWRELQCARPPVALRCMPPVFRAFSAHCVSWLNLQVVLEFNDHQRGRYPCRLQRARNLFDD